MCGGNSCRRQLLVKLNAVIFVSKKMIKQKTGLLTFARWHHFVLYTADENSQQMKRKCAKNRANWSEHFKDMESQTQWPSFGPSFISTV